MAQQILLQLHMLMIVLKVLVVETKYGIHMMVLILLHNILVVLVVGHGLELHIIIHTLASYQIQSLVWVYGNL